MANALVLGGTGHIGSHIVRALLANGHKVSVSYRSDKFLSVLDNLVENRLHLDLENEKDLSKYLEGYDWIFHAAGYYPRFAGEPKESINRGIESIRKVIDSLFKVKPDRVVFTSSAATIARVSGRKANETDFEPWPLPKGRSLYTAVKVAMEREILSAVKSGLPAVITNPSICLGEYDAHIFSGRAILAFAKNNFPFYLEQSLNLVYTGDVGIGHMRAAEKGKIGEKYILSTENVLMQDFGALVAKIANTRPPRWKIPYEVALVCSVGSEALAWITRSQPFLPRQALHPRSSIQILDGSKAVKELGMPQTSIEEAIRLALGWFRAHGYC